MNFGAKRLRMSDYDMAEKEVADLDEAVAVLDAALEVSDGAREET